MSWKTSPRIDVKLARQVVKLKHKGVKFPGFATYFEEQRILWSAQAAEDHLPWYIAHAEREIRETRRDLLKGIVAIAGVLTWKGLDADAIFAELGFGPAKSFKKFDDATLASEALRLRSGFYRKKREHRHAVTLGVRLNAEKIQDRLRSLPGMRKRLAGARVTATARVKRWKVALEKFRKSAERAGVKIRGL